MSPRAQELCFAGAMLVAFVVYTILSLELGPNARMIPLPMAVVGCLLTIWQLLRLTARDAETSAEPADQRVLPASLVNRELRALGGVAGAVFLILLLGPVAAVFVFTGSYLYVSGHYAAARSLIVAALFAAAIYLLFVVGLQLDLYHGILQPLVAPAP